MSKVTAAYLAGLIDGEGYIGLISNPRKGYETITYKPVLKIVMTNETMIRWLHQSFGGYFETRIFKDSNNKMAYGWSLQNRKQVQPFLEKVKPFLRIKKEQAETVITYCKENHILGGQPGLLGGRPLNPQEIEKRKALYEKIRHLNQRGILHAERLSESTS